MAAKYITVTYCDHRVGTEWLQAAFAESGTYQVTAANSTIESATAYIQSQLRRMNYTIPASGAAGEDVQLATFAVFYEMASARPENSQPLPEDWELQIPKVLLSQIVAGEAHLNLSQDTAGAEGGVLISETDPDISSEDGSRRKVFRRDEMSGR